MKLVCCIWAMSCSGSSLRLPIDVDVDAGVEVPGSIGLDYRIEVAAEDAGAVEDAGAGFDAGGDAGVEGACDGALPNACGGCGGIAGLAAGAAIGEECGGAGACIGTWECAGPNLAECGGCP